MLFVTVIVSLLTLNWKFPVFLAVVLGLSHVPPEILLLVTRLICLRISRLTASEVFTTSRACVSLPPRRLFMPLAVDSLMMSSKKKSGGGSSSAAPAIPIPPKPKTKRFRWIELKLYCDNPYHIDLFRYLRDIGQYQGCHILHDSDVKKDGNLDKPHWHVTLYSDTRQVTGIEVGGGRFLLKTWAASFGTFDAVVDSSGKPAAYLPPNWAVDYPLPIKSGKVKTFPVLTDAAGINDPSQWLLYMTHSDFKSIMAGKHRYNDSDLVVWDDSPTIQNYLTNSLTVSRSQSYELFEYSDGVSSGRELVDKLYSVGRLDLVDYVRKNPQYVAKFLIPGR